MSEIAYKVIRDDYDGNCVSVGSFGKAEVVYPYNKYAHAPEWLAAKGYHLTCFEDLTDAMRFAFKIVDFDIEIWECECEDRMPIPLRQSPVYLHDGVFCRNEATPDWPVGTVMYKGVKRVRKMEWWNRGRDIYYEADY